MKKGMVFMGVVLTVFALSGCASTNEDQIRIGVIGAFTGSQAKVGHDMRIALEIAQEDLREEYPNVELIFEDDEFKPHKSVSVFNQLVSLRNVDAIIGPLNGSSIESVRQLANDAEVLTVTPWGAANRIDEYLLKNSMEVKDEIAALTDLIVEQRQLTRLGVLWIQNDYGKVHDEEFRKQIAAAGAEVVISEEAPLDNRDYRPQFTKMKAAGIDGLYIVHNGGIFADAVAQAREMGLDVPVFGMYGVEASDVISVGGDLLDGVLYTYTLDDAEEGSRAQAFRDEFIERTGGVPQAVAYHTYDIYGAILEALEACADNDDATCPGKHIKNQSHKGVSGTFRYVEDEVKRDIYYKQIVGGEFVMYSE